MITKFALDVIYDDQYAKNMSEQTSFNSFPCHTDPHADIIFAITPSAALFAGMNNAPRSMSEHQ